MTVYELHQAAVDTLGQEFKVPGCMTATTVTAALDVLRLTINSWSVPPVPEPPAGPDAA